MRPTRPFLLLTAALVLAPLAALAGDEWEKDFQRDMSKPESWVKHGAISRLDVSNAKARDYLFNVLDKQQWYLRGAAISVLGGASGEALADLQKELKKHSSPFVREGIALAFGRSTDVGRADDLAEALKDKDEKVRRSAAIAIGNHGAKVSITGLFAAWEKEKDAETIVFYREALEKLTGKFLGRRLDDWKAWWKAVESDWKPIAKKEPKKPGEPDAPAGEKSEDDKKAEADGKKAAEETTVLRDVELNFKEAGKGGPLFILPEYGYKNLYLEKHMLVLDDAARLFFIDLPGVNKFKNLPPGATGAPEYPIDKLCDAFDELRKVRKQEKVAIMGHGIAAWVAMRYAAKFPKNVSHLILVSAWSSGKAWSDGCSRAENFGKQNQDIETEHQAQACQFDGQKFRYQPASQDDGNALRRAAWSGYFHDVRNSYASLFWDREVEADMGSVQIPMFDIAKEKGGPNPVPTLIFVGASPRAVWTSAADCRSLTKAFPNSIVVECPATNRMPMIEEHDRFVSEMRKFFKKFPFPKQKKEDAKK